MSVFTAGQARARADSVIAKAARAPVDEVYNEIESAAGQGLGTLVIGFAPFTFPRGGSTDPAAAPFLNELAGNGFILTADVDQVDGTTRLRITW